MTERCKHDVEILIIKTCKQNKLKIVLLLLLLVSQIHLVKMLRMLTVLL